MAGLFSNHKNLLQTTIKKAEWQKHSDYIFVAVALLVGILCGALLEGASVRGNGGYINYLVASEIHSKMDMRFFILASRMFLSGFLTQAVLLFFALSCIGAPAILITVFSVGFNSGALSLYLVLTYGFRGAASNLLIFLLPDLARGLLVLWFAAPAFDTSYSLLRANFKAQQTLRVGVPLQKCFRVFVLSSVALVPVSFLGAFLFTLFAPIFF